MERFKLLIFSILLFVNTVSAQRTCKNGGFQTSTTGCNCPSFWTGNDCGIIECINGGYPKDGVCICPQGYLGVHCDAVTLIQAPADQFHSSLPSFNLVYINLFSDYWGKAAKSQFEKAVNAHWTRYNTSYSGLNILTNINAPTDKSVTQDSSVYNFTVTNDTNVLVNETLFPKYYACYQIPIVDSITSLLIKANQLSQTAITVLTQHPLVGDTAILVNVAQAFGIRINIVWSDDDVFVRCGNSDIQGMKDLARQTGGLFISLTHDDSRTQQSIIDALLMSHYAYQPTDFASGTTSLVMSFLAYPMPTQNYYLFTTGKLNTTNYAVTEQYGSVNMNAYNIQNLVQRNTFTIDCSYVVDDCIALVFTNDETYYPLTVYSSFVEDVGVDSSNTQPDSGNLLHIALHVKNSGRSAPIAIATANNYQGLQENTVALNVSQRDRATFEFITDAINCEMSMSVTTYKYWWTTIIISVNGAKLQRVVRYNCQPISPNFAISTDIPSTQVTVGSSILNDLLTTVNSQQTSTEATMTTDAPCPAIPFEPLQFISGYADTVNVSIFNTFNVQTYKSAGTIYQKFGIIRFEVKQAMYKLVQVNTYSEYYNEAYGDMTWDSTLATQPQQPAQILDAIKTLASTNTVSQNAFASFLVDKLPISTSFAIEDYYPLVNRNIKLFMLMDLAAFKREVNDYQRNSYPLNTIAALTSGHFIISDQYADITFRSLLALVQENTAKQNLLISRNFQMGQQNLGQLDLSRFNSSVRLTITVTTEITDNWNENMFSLINIVFNGNNSLSPVNMTRTASSNFYTGTVTLTPDTYVIVAKIQTAGSVYLRIWSPRNVNMREVQVGYADLQDRSIPTPDVNNGAALRTYLFNNEFIENTNIQIRDCTGNPIKLFDHTQSVRSMSGSADSTGTTPSVNPSQLNTWSAFVPFFCVANADPNLSTCQKETTNLYTVQISGMTTAGPYLASKSFICGNSAETNATNAYLDHSNNFLCGGTTVPYTRGPTCHLRDCSGSGSLLYNSSSGNETYAPYRCMCNNADGESCEIGICPTQNESPGTSDSLYRTLTIVVGANKPLAASYFLENAKMAISGLTGVNNIWQYQLLLQCSKGDVYTLYIGSSFDSFFAKFDSTNIDCDYTGNYTETFSMEKMFSYATASVGRSHKGMIIFYNENPDLITVDKNEIVKYTQQYRQEIHVLSVVEIEDIKTYNSTQFTSAMEDMIYITFSTGGTFIVGEIDDTTFFPKPIPLYGYILGSSVSYNFMNPSYDKTTAAPFSFYVEQSASNAYLLVGSHQTLTIIGINGSYCTAGTLYNLCNLTANSIYTIQPSSLDKPIWATVIVADGITPMTAILQNKNADDAQTAFAVDYIDAGPVIGYQLPTNFEISNSSDVKLRISSRKQCTYSTTSYSISDPVTPIMNILQIGIKNKDDPSSKIVTKYLPISVSSAVACQNGGTPLVGIGACTCLPGFTGADCGEIVCNEGVQSTWGNACNCKDVRKMGRYCDKDKLLMSSFFATW